MPASDVHPTAQTPNAPLALSPRRRRCAPLFRIDATQIVKVCRRSRCRPPGPAARGCSRSARGALPRGHVVLDGHVPQGSVVPWLSTAPPQAPLARCRYGSPSIRPFWRVRFSAVSDRPGWTADEQAEGGLPAAVLRSTTAPLPTSGQRPAGGARRPAARGAEGGVVDRGQGVRDPAERVIVSASGLAVAVAMLATNSLAVVGVNRPARRGLRELRSGAGWWAGAASTGLFAGHRSNDSAKTEATWFISFSSGLPGKGIACGADRAQGVRPESCPATQCSIN